MLNMREELVRALLMFGPGMCSIPAGLKKVYTAAVASLKIDSKYTPQFQFWDRNLDAVSLRGE